MAKDKKGGDEKKATVTDRGNSLASKIEWRKRQSQADQAAAINKEGWVPGRRKAPVQEKDRCGACGHPSAVIRRGASLCTRCQGESLRARARQKARDLIKDQPRVSAAPKAGRPVSPLAAALTPVA